MWSQQKPTLTRQSKKLLHYITWEPRLPSAAAPRQTHLFTLLWISVIITLAHLCVCARNRVCLRKQTKPKTREFGRALVYDEYGATKSVKKNKRMNSTAVTSSPSLLNFCLCESLLWESSFGSLSEHNRAILLWHIQQRAFLCVCHTLRKTHANKHCDDLTTHAQTFVFHISVI